MKFSTTAMMAFMASTVTAGPISKRQAHAAQDELATSTNELEARASSPIIADRAWTPTGELQARASSPIIADRAWTPTGELQARASSPIIDFRSWTPTGELQARASSPIIDNRAPPVAVRNNNDQKNNNVAQKENANSQQDTNAKQATQNAAGNQAAITALNDASTAIDTAITALGGDAAASGQDQANAVDQANADKTQKAAEGQNAASGKDAGAVAEATNQTETGSAAGDGATAAAGGAVLPDGRIAADAAPEDFNVLASPFKSAVVKGDGLVFSDIISFPDVAPSMFDTAGNTKAFEISINDQSIFVPEGGEAQEQFRRADLLPSIASTLNDVAVTGKKTMHFSIQQDPAKPLALDTNEYQLSFLETADFAARQFDVRVGTGTTSPSLDGTNIVVLGRSDAADGIQEMFVTPFTADIENFAVTLDFDANTMQVFHSTGQTPLAAVTEEVANDNSGLGEYHFALLKLADANGEQAAGIDEAMVYSGIFMEDSADGTVTLQ